MDYAATCCALVAFVDILSDLFHKLKCIFSYTHLESGREREKRALPVPSPSSLGSASNLVRRICS